MYSQVFLSPPYVAEVQAAAATITNAALKAKALEVANVPNFIWFDQVAKVPNLGTYLAAAEAQAKSTGTPQLVQIVVYDLPDRDCAAKASNGEFQVNNGGQALYFNYIDQLVAQIKGKHAHAVASEITDILSSSISLCPRCGCYRARLPRQLGHQLERC